MQLISYISSKTSYTQKSIQNTVELLNEDCTIPFIARYRKERTGNLDEVEIGEIVEIDGFKGSVISALAETNSIFQLSKYGNFSKSSFRFDSYQSNNQLL